jgi:hypothetical protein
MNLFVLHLNAALAAQYHADKHVVKMLLEACQLLYSAHWVVAYPELLNYRYSVKLSQEQKKLSVPESIKTAPCSLTRPDEPGFRPVHLHHPCAQWVRESMGNYYWACQLALGLADEYIYRFGEKNSKVHSCQQHAQWLLDNIPELPSFEQTGFVQAMYPEFKQDDAVEAYRAYYRGSKGERGLLKYTRREVPDWI